MVSAVELLEAERGGEKKEFILYMFLIFNILLLLERHV